MNTPTYIYIKILTYSLTHSRKYSTSGRQRGRTHKWHPFLLLIFCFALAGHRANILNGNFDQIGIGFNGGQHAHNVVFPHLAISEAPKMCYHARNNRLACCIQAISGRRTSGPPTVRFAWTRFKWMLRMIEAHPSSFSSLISLWCFALNIYFPF